MKTLKNSRGQIGTTLTWIVAIFLILFVMLIYLAIVFWLRESVGSVQNEVLIENKYAGNDSILAYNLMSILRSDKVGDRELLGKICRWYYLRSPGGEVIKYSQLIGAGDGTSGRDENVMVRRAILYSWDGNNIKKSLYMQWVECGLEAG
ncbi:hypothetical protein J4447_00105 [Candidatus Pacearchaeota archaeon]|nr:hypothetical protein [Candidatus Pacearchaeota archaeon]